MRQARDGQGVLGGCSQRLEQQANRGGFRIYAVQFETWVQRLELGMQRLERQLIVQFGEASGRGDGHG